MLLLTLGSGFIPDRVDGHRDDGEHTPGGSEAEAEIRELLDSLDEDFLVVHGVSSPHGEIHHVVLSRNSGVFLIEPGPGELRGEPKSADPEMVTHLSESQVLDRCTRKTHWLRERITQIVGEKPWITSLLVIADTGVSTNLKVGIIRVINQTSLLPALSENGGRRRKSNRIWEARDLIADSLLL